LVLDFYIFIFLQYISDWRFYGVPTIRSDLAAPRIRRISDRTVSKSGCPRTGLENPGKSLNWKKKFQDWKLLENQQKSLKVLELISLPSSCANISDFD
jgi:hypothetical protein